MGMTEELREVVNCDAETGAVANAIESDSDVEVISYSTNKYLCNALVSMSLNPMSTCIIIDGSLSQP